MKARYDPGADALYVYLVDYDITGKANDNMEINDVYLSVDVDRDSKPLGIEVLWASKGFDLEPVIERFGLEEIADQLRQIQRREFKPDLIWKKTPSP